MSLYDTDFYAWVQEQSALLRSGRFDELDLSNLLEEIDDLAGRYRDTLASRMAVIVVHLLKFTYCPASDRMRNERLWGLSIKEQRRQIERLLRRNPSLRSEPAKILQEDYDYVRDRAADEALMPVSDFPETCPWSAEEVLSRDFWPG
jgi:hypothetical protein